MGRGWKGSLFVTDSVYPSQAVTPTPDTSSKRTDERFIPDRTSALTDALRRSYVGRAPTTPAPHPLIEARLRAALGLGLLVALAYALSSDRRSISWRLVAWGIGLQVAFALLVLRTPAGEQLEDEADNVVRGCRLVSHQYPSGSLDRHFVSATASSKSNPMPRRVRAGFNALGSA